MYVCICVYVCIYIYIYIETERDIDREREREKEIYDFVWEVLPFLNMPLVLKHSFAEVLALRICTSLQTAIALKVERMIIAIILAISIDNIYNNSY